MPRQSGARREIAVEWKGGVSTAGDKWWEMKWATKVREDKMKGQRRRVQTSGRVFVCASFELSLCHCQDEKAGMHVCGSSASTSGLCAAYQVVSPGPEPSGVSTSWLLSKYLEEIKKRGRENHMGRKNEKKEWERDREGLEPRAVLLLASSQRFFCETRGPGEQGQSALNFRLQLQRYRIRKIKFFPKALSSINEVNQRSYPVNWNYQY